MRNRISSPAEKLVPLVLLLMLGLSSTTYAGWWSRGDRVRLTGDTVERSYELDGFDRVSIGTVVECEILQGDAFAVELELDEALVDLVEVRVRRETLEIDLDEDVDWDDGDAIRARITLPALTGLELEGIGEIRGRDLDLEELEVIMAGVGSIELEGKVARLVLELEGVGDVDLSRLEAVDAEVELNGVGHAEVFVTGELIARVDGMGHLRYHGGPESVRPSVAGMGGIEAADSARSAGSAASTATPSAASPARCGCSRPDSWSTGPGRWSCPFSLST
jgi:hypothetical protein